MPNSVYNQLLDIKPACPARPKPGRQAQLLPDESGQAIHADVVSNFYTQKHSYMELTKFAQRFENE